jgi:hypothetical protein
MGEIIPKCLQLKIATESLQDVDLLHQNRDNGEDVWAPAHRFVFPTRDRRVDWQGAVSGMKRFLSGFQTLTFRVALWPVSFGSLYRRSRLEGRDVIGQGETGCFVDVSYTSRKRE